MPYKLTVPICVLLFLLTSCCPSPAVPTPAFTFVPTFTPSSPTPQVPATASPHPKITLIIHEPGKASAVQPVPIEVELIPTPGIAISPQVNAMVLYPDFTPYQAFALTPIEGNLYRSEEMLQLPLQPTAGKWWIKIDVESELRVVGKTTLAFRPEAVPFHNLVETLPSGTDLLVPTDFVEAASRGDQTAGARVWRHADGEVSLWWAPGPVKPLLLNTAIVMLEATYGTDGPAVANGRETEWQGQTAFLFDERWPGPEGGPGRAWVIQGPDYWLYVLRVRAIGQDAIPVIAQQVGETFAFVTEE